MNIKAGVCDGKVYVEFENGDRTRLLLSPETAMELGSFICDAARRIVASPQLTDSSTLHTTEPHKPAASQSWIEDRRLPPTSKKSYKCVRDGCTSKPTTHHFYLMDEGYVCSDHLPPPDASKFLVGQPPSERKAAEAAAAASPQNG